MAKRRKRKRKKAALQGQPKGWKEFVKKTITDKWPEGWDLISKTTGKIYEMVKPFYQSIALIILVSAILFLVATFFVSWSRHPFTAYIYLAFVIIVVMPAFYGVGILFSKVSDATRTIHPKIEAIANPLLKAPAAAMIYFVFYTVAASIMMIWLPGLGWFYFNAVIFLTVLAGVFIYKNEKSRWPERIAFGLIVIFGLGMPLANAIIPKRIDYIQKAVKRRNARQEKAAKQQDKLEENLESYRKDCRKPKGVQMQWQCIKMEKHYDRTGKVKKYDKFTDFPKSAFEAMISPTTDPMQVGCPAGARNCTCACRTDRGRPCHNWAKAVLVPTQEWKLLTGNSQKWLKSCVEYFRLKKSLEKKDSWERSRRRSRKRWYRRTHKKARSKRRECIKDLAAAGKTPTDSNVKAAICNNYMQRKLIFNRKCSDGNTAWCRKYKSWESAKGLQQQCFQKLKEVDGAKEVFIGHLSKEENRAFWPTHLIMLPFQRAINRKIKVGEMNVQCTYTDLPKLIQEIRQAGQDPVK